MACIYVMLITWLTLTLDWPERILRRRPIFSRVLIWFASTCSCSFGKICKLTLTQALLEQSQSPRLEESTDRLGTCHKSVGRRPSGRAFHSRQDGEVDSRGATGLQQDDERYRSANNNTLGSLCRQNFKINTCVLKFSEP